MGTIVIRAYIFVEINGVASKSKGVGHNPVARLKKFISKFVSLDD